MATTSKPRRREIAFEVGPEQLKRFWVILGAGTARSIDFTCIDGSTVTTDNLEDLLDFQNGVARRVTEIKFTNGYQSDTRVKITCSSGDYLRRSAISYEVSGEDKNVVYLSNELDHIIEGCRCWYSSIIYSAIWTRIAVALVVFALSFYWYARRIPYDLWPPILGLLVLLSILFGTTGPPIVDPIFPQSNILIGDGKIRAERARSRRTYIGTGLVLAIFASVLAGVFLKQSGLG
jgi:hypothetical protein